ncbi:Putative sugar ABC transport system, permease protein YtfT [Enterobacter hormaechei]|nr:Putative sugar ABC transport system, permease protein YtfT [Enterobacter hormaechei]
MSRSLSQTGEAKRRFSWPTGTPQIVALLLVLLVDSLVAPHFFPDRRAGWPPVW